VQKTSKEQMVQKKSIGEMPKFLRTKSADCRKTAKEDENGEISLEIK
jgi:hypothetical protein